MHKQALHSQSSVGRQYLLVASLLALALFTFAPVYAAPIFQAAGTAVNGTGAVSPAWPTHAIDDVALLIVESAGGEAVTLSSNTAGFALVSNSPQATGVGTAGTRITVFWARATSAAMAAPTVADPGNHVYAQILTYRGVIDTGDPWDVTSGGVKAVASSNVTVTGINTTVVDTRVVQIVARDNDSAAAAFSAITNANLTGITVRSDAGATSGNGGGFAVWDGVKATTTTGTGNTTATVTSSINAFLTIALKPQPPTVTSINRASANPSYAGDAVSWTVLFSESVTGVNAADFTLVAGGGVTGASITSVTGSGTTWTVTANSGTSAGTLGLNLVDDDSIASMGGTPLGGTGAGNGNFTGQVYNISPPFCSPPANAPAGVTLDCVCDRFGRASLNPSTIYGSNWIVSTSDATGIVPYINGTTGLLRLTENTGNNAKAATVPGIFPAAGNYISVEFQHFAYGGSGADGIAVTLSDYAVTAVPGAFGGSLGYAQKTPPAVAANVPGFAGGWVGIGIDEFGNYQNPTEGRIGGPGARVDSVAVRGSGSGVTGYNWIAGTTTLAPGIDNTGSATPAPGYIYQVIVDARNEPTSTSVSVNRNTGAGYVNIINVPNVYTAATAQGFTQAPVPDNWQISFTGSTGGATNVHEIGGLRVCAETVAPPSGGTASGFNAIDEAYGTPPSGPAVQSFLTGHIYLKLVGVPFRLNVAALNNNQILTTYAAGGARNVTVKLVDNSDNACVLDSTQANYCSAACVAKSAVAGGSQTLTFVAADAGKKQSANFTLNTAYKQLAAIISDGTTTACSTDAFAVRPTSVASVTSSNATNTGTGGTPIFKAGADNFSLTATTTGIAGNASGYTGVLKINSAALQVASPATVAGSITPTSFPAATPGTPSSTAIGSTFTYSEVGGFQFRGYNPASDTTSPRGVYEGVSSATECATLTAGQCDALRAATWMGIDSITSKGDCIQNSYSNTKDVNGKYGCSFGLLADSAVFGRFVPNHYALVAAPTLTLTNRSSLSCLPSSNFTYLGEPFRLTNFQLQALNATNAITRNYVGALAKLDVTDGNSFGVLTGTAALNTQPGGSSRISVSASGTNAWQTGASAGTTNTLSLDITVARKTGPVAGDNDPDGAFTGVEVGIAPADGDGVTLAASAMNRDWAAPAGNDHQLFSSTNLRYGRLALLNGYGSELTPIPNPIAAAPFLMQAQYYDTNTGFVRNVDDDCTAVPLAQLSLRSAVEGVAPAAAIVATNPIRVKGPVTTQASLATATMVDGNAGLSFSAPGVGGDGFVDVQAAVLNFPWLRYDWDGDNNYNEATGDDPKARITFGVYKGSPRHIYLRERY